jgi:hypothetical protein
MQVFSFTRPVFLSITVLLEGLILIHLVNSTLVVVLWMHIHTIGLSVTNPLTGTVSVRSPARCGHTDCTCTCYCPCSTYPDKS